MTDTVSGDGFLAATCTPLTNTVWLSFDEIAISAEPGPAHIVNAATSADVKPYAPERCIPFPFHLAVLAAPLDR